MMERGREGDRYGDSTCVEERERGTAGRLERGQESGGREV